MLDLRQGECSEKAINSVFDQGAFRSSRRPQAPGTVLKLQRCTPQHGQHVQQPGFEIVPAIVPTAGASLERVVVALLLVFDNAVQADVTPHLEAVLIESWPTSGVLHR